jgi:DNA-binding XRE family transcriptional regulator
MRLLDDARKIAAKIEAETHRIEKQHERRDGILAGLGCQLRKIRERLSITAAAMAKGMKISKTYVLQLEAGQRRWDIQLARKYIVALEKLLPPAK